MIDIDKYLDDKVNKGFVYFIYSNVLNTIYVGETISIDRINIYKSLIDEKDSKRKIMLYNFYTKRNTINEDLAFDIVNLKNEFKATYFQSKYHKHLEKTYILWLYNRGYSLYNTKLYKKHKYEDIEIDMTFINKLELTIKHFTR